MKSKILALILLTVSTLTFAQEALEEALILNDEMQFLENSAKNLGSAPTAISNSTARSERSKSVGEMDDAESLENTYFKDMSEDTVNTRTAAPAKKRRF